MSMHKIIELVGTSKTSWEDAAAEAVIEASKSLRNVRVAEVRKLDLVLENGKVQAYRARVRATVKEEMAVD